MRRPMQEHDSLERELAQLLALEESGGDGGGKWGDSKARKARVRQIKNRLAAKRSREHARTYVQELEGTLEDLQAKNEDLARRLQLALEQNDALMRYRTTKTESRNDNTGGDTRIGEPAAGRGPPNDALPKSLPLPSPSPRVGGQPPAGGRRTRSALRASDADLPALGAEGLGALGAEPSPRGGADVLRRELPPADIDAPGANGGSMTAPTPATPTAASPVTVPPTPPVADDAVEGEALMREDLGTFLLSGMSDDAGGSTFFDTLFAGAPDWASPDDDGCGDVTMG